jgi:hypothetical protein
MENASFENGLLLLALTFAAFLVLHFYLRLKVYGLYKKLMENQVDLKAEQLFSKKKMSQEVLPQYPHLSKEISTFQNHFLFSIKLGIGLVVLVIAFGGFLMISSRQF